MLNKTIERVFILKKNQIFAIAFSALLAAQTVPTISVLANTGSVTAILLNSSTSVGIQTETTFNFASKSVPGTKTVSANSKGTAPLYSDKTGFGFVSQTVAIPPREVDPTKIEIKDDCFSITETDEKRFELLNDKNEELELSKCTTYNFGGMVFRVKAPAGAYKIEVETTSGEDKTVMSVSGMQTTRIETNEYWDAAKLVPVKNKAKWSGNVWSFNYANGLPYIDIEIEPRMANTAVGIKTIKITPIETENREPNEKPSIFTVGDSTVKSYTFDEAPMCGWGQVIDNLFDSNKVNVINYSMGGRSMKSMYQEGRYNDILLTGKKGDYVLIQSGHNDERKGTAKGTADGENARFGGGSTEEMYKKFITDIYIPAAKARGMIPILVTPMTRVKGDVTANTYEYKDSFTNRKFPQIMREAAKETNTPLIDLNAESVNYLNNIGVTGATAIVMSLEAGETPGKTNSGSYANGHPDNKVDGTHFKESLAKQYAKIITEQIVKIYNSGDNRLENITAYLKNDVKDAIKNSDWSKVYPEVCNDTISGIGAYYRNQIEKMIQLGAMEKDENGNFNPLDDIYVDEFITSLSKVMDFDEKEIKGYKNERLTREVMAAILYDAYTLKFDAPPAYITDYNGTALSPNDPNYDANLVGEESQYYPLAGYETLTDTDKVSPKYQEKVRKAYNLGLIRTENGIKRGAMSNGDRIIPKQTVNRAKAAKTLYFMWVLTRPIKDETDWLYDSENKNDLGYVSRYFSE